MISTVFGCSLALPHWLRCWQGWLQKVEKTPQMLFDPCTGFYCFLHQYERSVWSLFRSWLSMFSWVPFWKLTLKFVGFLERIYSESFLRSSCSYEDWTCPYRSKSAQGFSVFPHHRDHQSWFQYFWSGFWGIVENF